jgi:hypothetical protein
VIYNAVLPSISTQVEGISDQNFFGATGTHTMTGALNRNLVAATIANRRDALVADVCVGVASQQTEAGPSEPGEFAPCVTPQTRVTLI